MKAFALSLLVAFALSGCVDPNQIHAASVTSNKHVGMASFYGKEENGGPTASGERFNMHALTAAHPTAPMGTKMRVTNLSNGRSVVVRINDRGPAKWTHRIIDLSHAAAEALGFINAGVTKVQTEIVQ